MVKFFVTLTVLLTLVFGKPVQVVSEDSPSSPKIQTLTAESRLENLTIEADLILGQQRQTQYQETQAGCRKETRRYKGRRKKSHEVKDLITTKVSCDSHDFF
jgi:hypothetical protein